LAAVGTLPTWRVSRWVDSTATDAADRSFWKNDGLLCNLQTEQGADCEGCRNQVERWRLSISWPLKLENRWDEVRPRALPGGIARNNRMPQR
jgi:hypothetical protein